ncbi:hypothetical protein FNAPI_3369 [Fusarium napiforme]|uniref:Uncharacterized protein n=1 Tax=Fusarium napiforme TaxID=42672 RepID=A0A8H5JUF5_9HYPO|nr:hypothetical protein FNAPI_3369 [Fusarium napiforme]
MRRVLGPISNSAWLNMSMMIGWCLHRYETDRSIPLQRHWDDADEERAARLEVWGLPQFALLVLLGVPFRESRHMDYLAIRQWTEDEQMRLEMIHGLGGVQSFGGEQQSGPSQEGAFDSVASGIDVHHQSAVNPFQAEAVHSVGSDTGALYRGTEAPYRLLENVLVPLVMAHVSGGIEDEDFEPAHQGSPPQNGNKRPRETEEDTSEEIQGPGRDSSTTLGIGNAHQAIKNEIKELQASIKEILEILEDSDLDSGASVTSRSSLEG